MPKIPFRVVGEKNHPTHLIAGLKAFTIHSYNFSEVKLMLESIYITRQVILTYSGFYVSIVWSDGTYSSNHSRLLSISEDKPSFVEEPFEVEIAIVQDDINEPAFFEYVDVPEFIYLMEKLLEKHSTNNIQSDFIF